jgi:hypothetical protein
MGIARSCVLGWPASAHRPAHAGVPGTGIAPVAAAALMRTRWATRWAIAMPLATAPALHTVRGWTLRALFLRLWRLILRGPVLIPGSPARGPGAALAFRCRPARGTP